MNWFPPPGRERTRLIFLLVLLAIAAPLAWYMQSGSNEVPLPTTTTPRTASNIAGVRDNPAQPAQPAARQAKATPTTPEPLKLPELEHVPDEPKPGRNPFRFGVPPPPPAPPPAPYVPPPTPTPPPPPPPPQVPLTLKGVQVLEPYQKNRAFLADKSGALFEAVAGDIVDGRYRVVLVSQTSAVVEFMDGSGRRTLQSGR